MWDTAGTGGGSGSGCEMDPRGDVLDDGNGDLRRVCVQDMVVTGAIRRENLWNVGVECAVTGPRRVEVHHLSLNSRSLGF